MVTGVSQRKIGYGTKKPAEFVALLQSQVGGAWLRIGVAE